LSSSSLADLKTATSDGRYRIIALALLTLSYAACHLDRNIITILLPAIKAEFGVSDAALGLLTGLTFAIFYGGFGIPLGYVADRANRRHLLGASLTLFSTLTLVSGLVTSFPQLVLARIGIGVGEGGAVPTAQSIIADLYPPKRRAFALGVYSTGLSIGALLGLGIGGVISAAYGWRIAFIVAGAASIAISLLCWAFIKETRRAGNGDVDGEAKEPTPGMLATLRHLWVGQRAYRQLVCASTIAAIPGFSLLVWTPTLLTRSFGMPQDQIGLWLALMFGGGGAVGILLSSLAANRLGRRSPAAAMWAPIVGCCLVGTFSILFPLATTAPLALALLVIPAAGYCCYTGPLYAAVHALVESRMRARAIAVLLLITNVGGFGLGPAIAGVLSDRMEAVAGAASLNYALLLMGFGWFWAALHFWLAGRAMRAQSHMTT
jgi:predicted MFS family arabinose efflux permease